VRKVSELYRKWKGLENRLEEERRKLSELQKMRDFLEYQLSELEDAELKEGEDEEIAVRLNDQHGIARVLGPEANAVHRAGEHSPGVGKQTALG